MITLGVVLFSFVLNAEQSSNEQPLQLKKETVLSKYKSKKYKIEQPKNTISIVNVEDPFEWKSFQDADIVEGLGRNHNQVHLLFAVRKGHRKNPGYPSESHMGLWLGYKDNNATWHSQGVISELTEYAQQQFNFRPIPVANQAVNIMAACADNAKYQHVFIQAMKMSPQGFESRLIYVKRTPQGHLKIKLSQPLGDDMGHTMRCVADSTNTIHLFGLHNWATESYSKIVHYKLDWNEQEKQDKFFTMARTELPSEFETHEFTAWNSGQSIDLLFNLRDNTALSLARRNFQGGQPRSIASVSDWRILTNNNGMPDNNPHMMRDRHGFSYGRNKRAHVLGRLTNPNVNGSVQRGIAYYYQDRNGAWKSKGFVLNKDLSSLSVTSVEARPIFYMIGATRDGQVWYGYYHNQQQKWVDGGIVFNKEVK